MRRPPIALLDWVFLLRPVILVPGWVFLLLGYYGGRGARLIGATKFSPTS